MNAAGKHLVSQHNRTGRGGISDEFDELARDIRNSTSRARGWTAPDRWDALEREAQFRLSHARSTDELDTAQQVLDELERGRRDRRRYAPSIANAPIAPLFELTPAQQQRQQRELAQRVPDPLSHRHLVQDAQFGIGDDRWMEDLFDPHELEYQRLQGDVAADLVLPGAFGHRSHLWTARNPVPIQRAIHWILQRQHEGPTDSPRSRQLNNEIVRRLDDRLVELRAGLLSQDTPLPPNRWNVPPGDTRRWAEPAIPAPPIPEPDTLPWGQRDIGIPWGWEEE